MITIDDFKKLDIRLGKILSAEKVPDTDKLVHFSVDCGEEEPRSIVSGVAPFFDDPTVLVGVLVPVLMNLEIRIIRGVESKGMILYVVGDDSLTTLSPKKEIPPGTPIQ